MSQHMHKDNQYLPGQSIEDLIQLALVQMDSDADDIAHESDALGILQWDRDPAAVFTAIQRLRTSTALNKRVLFVTIIGQLNSPRFPFREETVTILLSMLQEETAPEILSAIGIAFGHLGDPRAIEPLVQLTSHVNADVRFGVVAGLLGHEQTLAINALIELSHDPDRDVRDWATFGLGSQIEIDTPEIREALLARVTDDDPEVRGEALIGLAKRQDMRVMEALHHELTGDFYGIWAVEAAELLAEPALYPLIQALWERVAPTLEPDSRFADQFRAALKACSPK